MRPISLGYRVTVLEAQMRMGGRIYTTNQLGADFNLGVPRWTPLVHCNSQLVDWSERLLFTDTIENSIDATIKYSAITYNMANACVWLWISKVEYNQWLFCVRRMRYISGT